MILKAEIYGSFGISQMQKLKAILIGHKQNQESDFNYLSENDDFDL